MKYILIVIVAIIVLVFIVDAVNRIRLRSLRESGIYPPEGKGTDADVDRLIRLGKKISAIKLYREIYGVDLKAAKEAVEELARKQNQYS